MQAIETRPLGRIKWQLTGEGGGTCVIWRERCGPDVLIHMRYCDRAPELLAMLNNGDGQGALALLKSLKTPRGQSLAASLRAAITDLGLLIDLYG